MLHRLTTSVLTGSSSETCGTEDEANSFHVRAKLTVRGLLRSLLEEVGLLKPIRQFADRLADRKTRQAFDQTRFKKLHLGCGPNRLPGWFNTDLKADGEYVFRLDATKPFPFPSNSFEEIFTEHMIEHIPYTKALSMLKECYRVLQPGGKLRSSQRQI